MLLCRSINHYSKRLRNVLEARVVTTEMNEPFYSPNYTHQHLSTVMPCTPFSITLHTLFHPLTHCPQQSWSSTASVSHPLGSTSQPSSSGEYLPPFPHQLSSSLAIPDSTKMPKTWTVRAHLANPQVAYRGGTCLGESK